LASPTAVRIARTGAWRRANASSSAVRDGDQRGQAAEIKSVQNQPGVTLVEIEAAALPEPRQQLQHRDDERTEEHQPAPGAGGECLETAQRIQRHRAGALTRRARRTAGAAFAIEHQHHRQQQ